MTTSILATRLRAARTSMIPEVTQRDVATRLHRSPSAVNFWEKGKTEPSATDLAELAKWFKVSVDWLVGLDKPRSISSTESGLPLFTVPVVPPSSVGGWELEAPIELLQTKVAYQAGTAAAFVIQNDALESVCPPGSYAVISRAHLPQSGDVVGAFVPGSVSPMVRRMIAEGTDTFLIADDSRYPSRTVGDGVEILGKVVELVTRKVL